MARRDRPETPDGRYQVARGVLRRNTDPALGDSERRWGIKTLMKARLAARNAVGAEAFAEARAAVEAAKRALGEAGPVWWDDGAPDETGVAPEASSYAGWWLSLSDEERERGG